MLVRPLDPDNLAHDEDWEGNNAAFTCPLCGKVFIVSGLINDGERECPHCHKATGRCDAKGKKSGGTASILWQEGGAGMDEAEERRFDAIASLRTGQWKNFNERRQYEWKFAFGLWTAGALAVSNFIVQGPICVERESIIWFGMGIAGAAIVAHLAFLLGLHRVNVLDRRIMRDDERRLRAIARANLEANLERDIRNRDQEQRPFLRDWSYVPQFLITLCLYSAIILLLKVSHVRPSCSGESWTVSTQNGGNSPDIQLSVQKD